MPNEEYLTPHEAAERLFPLVAELEQHGVPKEHRRSMRRQPGHHLDGLAAFSNRLHDLAEEFSW